MCWNNIKPYKDCEKNQFYAPNLKKIIKKFEAMGITILYLVGEEPAEIQELTVEVEQWKSGINSGRSNCRT